jgi:hypothetical protein
MRRRHEGEERAQSTLHSKRRRERARKWRAAASAASMRRNGRWQAAARFAAVASLRAVAAAKAQAAGRRSTLRPLSCAPHTVDADSSRRAREGTGTVALGRHGRCLFAEKLSWSARRCAGGARDTGPLVWASLCLCACSHEGGSFAEWQRRSVSSTPGTTRKEGARAAFQLRSYSS